jgi:hypothetical protein
MPQNNSEIIPEKKIPEKKIGESLETKNETNTTFNKLNQPAVTEINIRETGKSKIDSLTAPAF